MADRGRPAVLGIISEERGPGRLLVTLDGVLDHSTSHLVEVALRSLPASVHEVVIDLSSLRDIGPGGAGALALGYRELVDGGRRVVVRDPSPAVHELLERWKLTELVEQPQSGELDLRLERLLSAIVALDQPEVDLREPAERSSRGRGG